MPLIFYFGNIQKRLVLQVKIVTLRIWMIYQVQNFVCVCVCVCVFRMSDEVRFFPNNIIQISIKSLNNTIEIKDIPQKSNQLLWNR